jgi:hypothetical protein
MKNRDCPPEHNAGLPVLTGLSKKNAAILEALQ